MTSKNGGVTKHPASASPELAEPCLTSVAKLRVAHGPEASPIVSDLFAPWGVQTSASFSKGSALRAFARTRHTPGVSKTLAG